MAGWVYRWEGVGVSASIGFMSKGIYTLISRTCGQRTQQPQNHKSVKRFEALRRVLFDCYRAPVKVLYVLPICYSDTRPVARLTGGTTE